jgi:hypothetical protein
VLHARRACTRPREGCLTRARVPLGWHKHKFPLRSHCFDSSFAQTIITTRRLLVLDSSRRSPAPRAVRLVARSEPWSSLHAKATREHLRSSRGSRGPAGAPGVARATRPTRQRRLEPTASPVPPVPQGVKAALPVVAEESDEEADLRGARRTVAWFPGDSFGIPCSGSSDRVSFSTCTSARTARPVHTLFSAAGVFEAIGGFVPPGSQPSPMQTGEWEEWGWGTG